MGRFGTRKMTRRERRGVRRINRSLKRRRRKKKSGTVRQRGVAFAASQVVKLRYCDSFTLDAGTNTTVNHVFSCNDLYDPNVSGTGHQPMGFDQWANFYDHYTVIGAKIRATFQSNTAVGADAGIVGILLKDNTTEITGTSSSIMEQGLATWRNYAPTGQGKPTTMYKGFAPKKFFGIQDIKDNKTHIGANFATIAGPTEQAYFHVFQAGLTTTTNPGAILCNVQIDYIVILTEPKALAQS